MILPDTNIFIYCFAGIEPYASSIKNLVISKELAICPIVTIEFLAKADPEDAVKFQQVINLSNVLPITDNVAQCAVDYRQRYEKLQKKDYLADTIIAATCKVYGLTLATLDKSGYPMKDIKIIDKF